MSKKIEITEPVSVPSEKTSAYEFVGKSSSNKQVRFIFLERGACAIEPQIRNRLFCAISARRHDSLQNRSIIQIKNINSKGQYVYAFREKGRYMEGTIDKASLEQSAKSEPQVSIGKEEEDVAPLELRAFKIHELSVREFKQAAFSNALIHFIRALVDILNAPFAFIYRKCKGGEARQYSSMLSSIDHDRVGETDHESVLSQVRFMSTLLARVDPEMYSVDLEKPNEVELMFHGTRYSALETKTHYEVQFPEFERKPNPFYQPHLPIGKKNQSETWNEDNLANYVRDNFYRNWNAVSPCENDEKRKVVLVPKKHPLLKSCLLSRRKLSKEEAHIEVLPASQRASKLFSESYVLGTKIHEAVNSGSRKRKEKVCEELEKQWGELSESHPLLVPVAQGEGRDYLPHFLVFLRTSTGVFLKDICFFSTSVEKARVEVIKTYDITETFNDEKTRLQLARSLLSMQSISLAQDKTEKSLKGPLEKDLSLDKLLLEFGKSVDVISEPKKTSRDPIKALFTVLRNLEIQEDPHLSSNDHRKFEDILETKSRFFKAYVDNLVTYYEENESKLSGSQRVHFLEGILRYTEKVRHYAEKEAGVKTASSIADHLVHFVEKKLDELKRTEQQEAEDIKNLENSVILSRATLAEDISQTVSNKPIVADAQIPKIPSKIGDKINQLRIAFEKGEKAEHFSHKKIQDSFCALIQDSRNYLKAGDPLSAKILLLALMQAIPPAGSKDLAGIKFWDTLQKEQLDAWLTNLSSLSEAMFESILRSDSFPQKPHEVFEFNVALPLLQRYLFGRKIPLIVDEFDEKMRSYQSDEDCIKKLEAKKQSFISMRNKEIEADVTKRLKREWKDEDKLNALLKNSKISTENLKAKREHELKEKIQSSKDQDFLLRKLKILDVKNLDIDSMDLLQSGERMQAIIGSLICIIGIPKAVLAYKIGKLGWITATFSSKERSEGVWLLDQDYSLPIGGSLEDQKRYDACKITLQSLSTNSLKDSLLAPMLIGYDALGDGTQILYSDREEKLKKQIQAAKRGFFNAHEGSTFLVPEEMAQIRKTDERRKIIKDPESHLMYYREGILGAVKSLLFDNKISLESLRKIFVSLPSVDFIAAMQDGRGCFLLSGNTTLKGSLCTTNVVERPSTHFERKKYLGQMTPEMASEKMQANKEAEKLNQIALHPLYTGLAPIQEFVLLEASLADEKGALSYVGISRCMHLIALYPELIQDPRVRHTLYKTFFHHGLIQEYLLQHPEFFIEAGKTLRKVCQFLQTQEHSHRISDLFIREVSERIRRFACEIYKESRLAKDIDEALPPYDAQSIIGLFLQNQTTKEQKLYATYALSYYCHKIPKKDDVESWRNLFNAFFILQKSPFEIGHSGMQEEIVFLLQTKLFPLIAKQLKEDISTKNELLKQLTGREGKWTSAIDNDYVFYLQTKKGVYEVDLVKGKGFKARIETGEMVHLPEQIRSDNHFRFIFGDLNPLVISKSDVENIIDYHWYDKTTGKFIFRYHMTDRTLQIIQVHRNQEFQFQILKLSESNFSKFWQLFARHKSQFLENLIAQHGVWIPIDEQGRQNTSRVLVTQFGFDLSKEAITLEIEKNKIVRATVGKGENKKYICSGLKDKNSTLLTFRNGTGLLMLSKDGKHVDEIRFPFDPSKRMQLILKKDPTKNDRWFVSGREDWIWQLTDTKKHEVRFGKKWRDFILPLRNKLTGEEENWIFPYLAVGNEKRGQNIKFVKFPTDLIDAIGGELSKNGEVSADLDKLKALVGSAQSFLGTDALMEFGENALEKASPVEQLDPQEEGFSLLKSSLNPRAITYKVGRQTESSSHAGFFYLAFIAHMEKEWGTASRYLQLLSKNGHSNLEDAKQLQGMLKVFLGMKFLSSKENFSLKGDILSPLQCAFFAKLIALLLSLHTRFKANFGFELFPEDSPEDSMNMHSAIQSVGGLFYTEYRKLLTTHDRQFKEYGLQLSKEEERIFSEDFKIIGAAALLKGGLEAPQKTSYPTPIQFKIPNSSEIETLAESIADSIQPKKAGSDASLHRLKGSYPKISTVLSNFWDYWKWIYENNVKIEEISFLMREIPKGKDQDKIDVARRMLLTFWHYTKSQDFQTHRLDHGITEETLVKEIQKKRGKMPNFSAMEEKNKGLEVAASMEPSPFRIAHHKLYEVYLKFRHERAESIYLKDIGGVLHERQAKGDFVKIQKDLLNLVLAPLDIYRTNKIKILPFRLGDSQPYIAPPERKKEVGALTRLKEEAWQQLLPTLSFLQPAEKTGIKQFFDIFLDLPDFNEAWNQLEANLLQSIAGDFNSPMTMLISPMKFALANIHSTYAKRAGFPPAPYPRTVKKASYETVEIKKPAQTMDWKQFFVDVDTSRWDEKRHAAKKEFDPLSTKIEREKHKLEKICAGIDVAAEEMKGKTSSALNATQLEPIYHRIRERSRVLIQEHRALKNRILDFAKWHAEELDILYLFTDSVKAPDKTVLEKVLDLYRYGELGKMEDLQLQTPFAELITEYLLVTSELQQLQKAKNSCRALASILIKIKKEVPFCFSSETFNQKVQKMASASLDWLLHSADLKNYLEEGSDRLRYSEEVDGRDYLTDQKFTRRYLVSDVRNHWISRKKATAALEDLLKDLREKSKNAEPVRFIKAKMGTGKSDFIFPEAIDLLIQEGYEPIMVTTDELVKQLQSSMGHIAHVFEFSINFGMDKLPEEVLYKILLGSGVSKQDLVHKNKSQLIGLFEKLDASKKESLINAHLRAIKEALNDLKKEKKAILTSPSQIASLRNKRAQLQDRLCLMPGGNERTLVFEQLQLIKEIEAHFRKPSSIYLIDEDNNFDISFEYNFATGNYRSVDLIRFNVSEQLIRILHDKHPQLWDKILKNDLRSVEDVAKDFREVARNIYRDFDFWENTGWDLKIWKSIPEEEFIDFVLGLRENLPQNMPEWNKKLNDTQQVEKAYVAALKTYLSKTLETVKGVNPKLGRGVSSHDQITVAPRSDGEEKPGVLYGEESENILHHIFHYCAAGNESGQEFFIQKYKALGGLEMPINPMYPETWKMWANQIAAVYAQKKYLSLHEAFQNDPQLAIQRIQYLRHLMLETGCIRVYLEQIMFNSQDLGLGVDVRVGSGTGEPYALNLSDYLKDSSASPDAIFGETLLCMDLSSKTTVFKGSAFAHIKRRAKDPKCVAILNYDYEVMKNESEKIAATLRDQGLQRQMIYRDSQLEKRMWNAGEQFSPMDYEQGAIDRSALFLYMRRDSRGVHFHVPRGADQYGDTMIGTGNEQEAIVQLVWRLRHLDMGHRVVFSHDEKTAKQIRKACSLGSDKEVTVGNAMRYFTLNTLRDEDVKNVKATIFKASTPLKRSVDLVTAKPYDLLDVKETNLLEEIEGKVIFKALRSLYIIGSEIRWIHEYQPQQKIDATSFVRKLYADEMEKISRLKEQFQTNLSELLEEKKVRLIQKLLSWCDNQLEEKIIQSEFDRRLFLLLRTSSATHSANDRAIAREVLYKYFSIQRAFQTAFEEVEIEIGKLDDKKYKQFLLHHLPEKIPVDLEQGMRGEQKTQQHQEQKREQKQEKLIQNFVAYNYFPKTQPLNFFSFKQFVLDRKDPSSWNSKSMHYDYYFDNSTFEALKDVRILPEGYFENIYLSKRAGHLLKALGKSGAPAVEILFLEDKGKYHSVIIAPTERMETVAKAMGMERKNPSHRIGIAIYAFLNETFSSIKMDEAKKINEDDKQFLHAMIMNKLLLNWTHFSLEEVEYLTQFIKSLNKSHLREFFLAINNCAPETAQILMSIVRDDRDWLLKVAKRKLEANFLDKNYSKLEIEALKEWISATFLTESEFQIHLNNLQSRFNALNSVNLLQSLKM